MLRLTCFRSATRRLIIERDPAKKVIKISGSKNPEPTNLAAPIPEESEDTCPLRARGIEVTKNDVLILRQFMRSDGSILKLEHTNLGDRTYKKVVSCIRQAQREGLLPTDEPEYCVAGAPLVKNAVYSEARYPKGTRIDQWRLKNRGQREDYRL